MAEGGAAHSPLEQFEIKPIFGGGEHGEVGLLTFTNSSLMMVVALGLVSAFLILGMRRGALVPGRMQSLAEMSYEFIAGLISDTVGAEGRRYFPIVFTLFMFILFGNLLGMLPYSFTFTSHIIVTFAMAAVVFIGVTILGFAQLLARTEGGQRKNLDRIVSETEQGPPEARGGPGRAFVDAPGGAC